MIEMWEFDETKAVSHFSSVSHYEWIQKKPSINLRTGMRNG